MEIDPSVKQKSQETPKTIRTRPALGRGLDVLFSSADEAGDSIGETSHVTHLAENVNWLTIPVGNISPHPDQPRRRFNKQDLEELAQSLADQGILQPLLLRRQPGAGDTYQIIAGERRWRAAQIAGLHEVPAIVRDISDEDVVKVSLIENIQRSDLTAVEEARALQLLVDTFNHTQESASRVVGKSRSYVANSLRLLSLTESLLHTVEEQGLSAGHARCLIGLPANQAADCIKDIVRKGLSVRATEQMTQRLRDQKDNTRPNFEATSRHAQIKDIEDTLGQALGFRVRLRFNAQNKGNLSLYFNNSEELNNLIKRLADNVAI